MNSKYQIKKNKLYLINEDEQIFIEFGSSFLSEKKENIILESIGRLKTYSGMQITFRVYTSDKFTYYKTYLENSFLELLNNGEIKLAPQYKTNPFYRSINTS